MSNFINRQDLRYIAESDLEKKFSEFHPGYGLTKGEYRFPATCSVDDLDWNHVDQDHRPFIHKTYNQSIRLFTDSNSSISLTKFSFWKFSFWIQIIDLKIKRGLFYQCFSVFNLVHFHGILKNSDKDMVYQWYIFSPRGLKPLRSRLSQMMYKLNHVQIAEDIPVRERRKTLRSQGYRFDPDERNFLTGNSKGNHTAYPKLSSEVIIPINQLDTNRPNSFGLAENSFLAMKGKDESILIWRSTCPHEGGPLAEGKLCGDQIKCPWHGHLFPAVKLNASTPLAKESGLQFELKSQAIHITD